MSCCGKKKTTISYVARKTKHIVQGYFRLFRHINLIESNNRINICQVCEKKVLIKNSLWCSICKCFIPAKSRVEEEDCPLGKWPTIEKAGKNQGE